MEKYLKYLHHDIHQAIAQAPPSAPHGWIPVFPEDEGDVVVTQHVVLTDLIDIPAEAFPPEHLLTDKQLTKLLDALESLWKAWRLHWEMPLYLPERKQYSAMLREMNGEPVPYHPERGGTVEICNLDSGKCCPFQPGEDYCFCSYIRESTRHDIALWEEYVHSQGLDPYRELTPEEEEAFEEEMKVRNLKKRYGDDWKKYYNYEFLFDSDDEDDFSMEDGFDEEQTDLSLEDEWEDYIFPVDDEYDGDYFSDEDDLDIPF